ncbi:MAG: hypothetical protein K2X55_21590 [Burkholderiaceae bacterium]|nr:hypothetical protein [Burkholderiaceae bacterium]
MAMIECKECAVAISSTAKACPKCGAVVPRRKVWPWIVGTPVALFAALVLYGFTIPEYEARAREVRNVCEKLAAHHERYVCDQQYAEAIRNGRINGAK